MQLLWMKIIEYSCIVTIIFGMAVIYLILYILKEDKFYFLIILFCFLYSVYVTIKIAKIITSTVFMANSISLYLKLRFQQINQQFKRITNKNLNSLEALIKAHNRVTVMVNDCDLLISKLYGAYYFYAPFLVNILLFITIYGNSVIYTRIIAGVLATFTTIGLYLLSYMPAQLSTEAHQCYKTINSLNARYKIPLKTKLKVRSFSAQFEIMFLFNNNIDYDSYCTHV
jgi:hypothetical protein